MGRQVRSLHLVFSDPGIVLWLRSRGLPLLTLAFLLSCSRGEDLPALPQVAMADFLPEVRSQLETALAHAAANPHDAEASGRLGMVLHAYEHYGTALACYRRASILAPQSFAWAYLLGVTHEAVGETVEAVAALRQALLIGPDYVGAQLRLGEILLGSGKPGAARDVFQALVAQRPDVAAGHFGLGQALLQEGQPEAAVGPLEQALALGGPFGAVYYQLFKAYQQMGRADEAQSRLALFEIYRDKRLRVDDPVLDLVNRLDHSDQAHVTRAGQHLASGRVEAAIAEYGRAIEINPRSLAHANLADLYARRGRLELAEHHYRKALEINPGLARLHLVMGTAWLQARDYGKAATALRYALEQDQSDANIHTLLGMALDATEEPGAALQHYHAALENDPTYRQAHFMLGLRLVDAGAVEEGIEHLEQTRMPEDERTPAYLRGLARAYLAAGRPEQARQVLERARSLAAGMQDKRLLGLIERELQTLGANPPPVSGQ